MGGPFYFILPSDHFWVHFQLTSFFMAVTSAPVSYYIELKLKADFTPALGCFSFVLGKRPVYFGPEWKKLCG